MNTEDIKTAIKIANQEKEELEQHRTTENNNNSDN